MEKTLEKKPGREISGSVSTKPQREIIKERQAKRAKRIARLKAEHGFSIKRSKAME